MVMGVSGVMKRRLKQLESNIEFRGAPKNGGYYVQ